MANGLAEDDTCRWNHDILGINKACKLLKDARFKTYNNPAQQDHI
jgi:hypothetical protein